MATLSKYPSNPYGLPHYGYKHNKSNLIRRSLFEIVFKDLSEDINNKLSNQIIKIDNDIIYFNEFISTEDNSIFPLDIISPILNKNIKVEMIQYNNNNIENRTSDNFSFKYIFDNFRFIKILNIFNLDYSGTNDVTYLKVQFDFDYVYYMNNIGLKNQRKNKIYMLEEDNTYLPKIKKENLI